MNLQRSSISLFLTFLFILLIQPGCCLIGIRLECCAPATAPIKNEPITRKGFEHPPSKELSGKILVGLALSGGGVRSAVYSANVMENLWKLSPPPGQKGLLERGKNLMDEVDYLSSCSGGSVAASYYCLNRPPRLNQKFFDNFRFGLENYLIESFGPCDLVRIISFYSYQTEQLIDYWNEQHFQNQTFRHIYHREKRGLTPILLLNSVALSHQKRFIFTNENLTPLKGQPVPDDFMDFKDIYSDIKKFEVARGAAASAAVPGLFRAVTLIDFKTSSEKNRQYVHLLDGGLEDNIAARILFQIFRRRLEKDPSIKGALLIIVDASQPPTMNLRDYRSLESFQGAGGREGLTTAMESIGLMMHRSTERIKTEINLYSQAKKNFKVLHIDLDYKISMKIPTDWTLSGMDGKEGEVLRREARKGVKEIAPKIWEYLARLQKETRSK